MEYADLVETFASGAEAILGAFNDVAVDAHWDRPSVLEGQLVSGLAGHLARGGVWVVGDYLDLGSPTDPLTFGSAGEYFAHFVGHATPDGHEGIRDRGRQVGSVGRVALVEQLQTRTNDLVSRLHVLDGGRLLSVAGGAVMRLDDYLETRIVEQTVHLDDLGRSVGHEGWAMNENAGLVSIDVAIDVARRLHGDLGVVRAVFRRGFTDAVFPVF